MDVVFIFERKMRWDGSITDYECELVERGEHRAVLRYQMPESFTISLHDNELYVPEGSYTLAYYWPDRHYNVYVWYRADGDFLGAYFNIVKNTVIEASHVSYQDLIIDLLVLPNGRYYILDEDELPVPLAQFEGGAVLQALEQLIDSHHDLLKQLLTEGDQHKHAITPG